MGEDALLQRRRIRNAAHETIDCRRIHDGVDQYVWLSGRFPRNWLSLGLVASRCMSGTLFELRRPPDHLVRVLHRLIEGLVMQRILTPELWPDTVFYGAFGALAKR